MIAFPSTLGQLRDDVARMIEVAGPDAPVGSGDNVGDEETIDVEVQLDLVYINAQGYVVGTEANDYRPKPGERAAVRVY